MVIHRAWLSQFETYHNCYCCWDLNLARLSSSLKWRVFLKMRQTRACNERLHPALLSHNETLWYSVPREHGTAYRGALRCLLA